MPSATPEKDKGIVSDDLGARRARLAEIEHELVALRHRHDLAMSAFQFEEATGLRPAIAALERERDALASVVPPDPEPPTGVVPVLAARGRATRIRPKRQQPKFR